MVQARLIFRIENFHQQKIFTNRLASPANRPLRLNVMSKPVLNHNAERARTFQTEERALASISIPLLAQSRPAACRQERPQSQTNPPALRNQTCQGQAR